jgi:hypothetical protein
MEITEELLKSKNNDKQISLQVVSNPSNIPDMFYNYLSITYTERRGKDFDLSTPFLNRNQTGVNGTVELILSSPVYIKDLFIYTKVIRPDNARLHVIVEVDNTTTDLFEGKVALDIKRWYPEEVDDEEKFTLDVYARPLTTTVVEQDIQLTNPILWESWNPNLYIAHATLLNEDRPVDDLYETFGVRTFIEKQGKFFLNGNPIMLTATHCGQGMYPETSITCPGDYWIVQDYLLHKALGMVASRYPSDNRVHYRRIAEYADQIGLMLIWEGYCSVWTQNPHIEDLARRDIPLMVRDLRNHPSIIVWVFGDETFYYDASDSEQNIYPEQIFTLR